MIHYLKILQVKKNQNIKNEIKRMVKLKFWKVENNIF
jgi:hypothetical protein